MTDAAGDTPEAPAANRNGPLDGSGGATAVGKGAASQVDRLADAVADAVPAADASALDVAPSRFRPIVLVGLLFSICSIVLVPWTIFLAVGLPTHALDENFNVTWSGFDVILFVSLSLTAMTAIRRSTWMVTAAGGSAALLVADAWFDISTSFGGSRLVAVLMAVIIELPLAGLCVWACKHSQDFIHRELAASPRIRGANANHERP